MYGQNIIGTLARERVDTSDLHICTSLIETSCRTSLYIYVVRARQQHQHLHARMRCVRAKCIYMSL